MQSGTRRFVCRFLVLSVFLLAGFSAICQPPTTIPSQINPSQLNPQNLSQSQLSSLLSDKNKENVGKDKNAAFEKESKLVKDSTQKDNIKSNSYSPDRTFGANVFVNSAVTDLSELSTPPLDYPIGVGD
ncbi:MAG: hypothetical protein EOP54_25390, partial [Sphingobacteriales bacterium]